MKKATLEIIAKLLKGEEVKDPETATAAAIEEIEAEVNKGAEEKAEKAALYAAAEPVVMEALEIAGTNVTAAELFEECKGNLPSTFTKAQLNYGLTHQWKDKVVKTEGKVNTYRLA